MKTLVKTPSVYRTFVLCVSAVLGFSCAAPLWGQPPAGGQSPAERRAREFLEVANSGNEERIRQYVKENFAQKFLEAIPVDEHVRIISTIPRDEGGFDIRRVMSSGSDAVTFIMQARRTKEWRRMNLRVEDQPPYHIAGIGIMPTTAIALEIPTARSTTRR